MRPPRGTGPSLAILLALAIGAGLLAPVASAAPGDPLFILRPESRGAEISPIPPPLGRFEGPCGLAVDGGGSFYVSDYYHHVVDVYSSAGTYSSQLAGEDPLDGPCGLALDPAGNLYVNNFHRNVVRFGSASGFGTGALVAGGGVDGSRPTGVAIDPGSGTVYVDERDHLASFDPAGVEGEAVGAGTLEDGYGVAVSRYPTTAGFVYAADAADDIVDVYDPATSRSAPVATIDGSATPTGGFVSLRDSAVAVDDATGTVYVVDDLTPEYSEGHEAVVYAFGPTGSYLGRLKFSVETAQPAGLAVDNSGSTTQGRVYVTSGYSENAAVYAYPPGSAGAAAVPLAGAVLSPAADIPASNTPGQGPLPTAASDSPAAVALPGAAAAVGSSAKPGPAAAARRHRSAAQRRHRRRRSRVEVRQGGRHR